MTPISDNGISRVWLDNGWVYKRQMMHLTNNEIWCLQAMSKVGYSPKAERMEIELIRTKYIKPEIVTDSTAFMMHFELVLNALETCQIRHGDLTIKNIIVADNKLYLIDFAESRLFNDPRQDKRPEGDYFWLKRSMETLCKQ